MRVYTLLLSGSMIALQTVQRTEPLRHVSEARSLPQTAEQRDGQRDFDFEIGTWNTKLSRLSKPMSGSSTWVEYTGTTTVRKVWDGRRTAETRSRLLHNLAQNHISRWALDRGIYAPTYETWKPLE